MFLGAEQLAIPPLGVEPLVLDEDLFLLAMSRALENTLPLLQSKMQSVIHNVFEQFRLTTPPPGRYQQRPLEQSSTPISDPKTQIEIIHSHLWKARSKQVALKSTAVIGGVKKRHRSRLGTYGFLATDTHPKRKVSFQRLVAEIALDVKVDWRSQSSVVPSLLGSTVSTQVNNTHASFCSVSNTGTLSFVNNGCGAVDSVFVGSIHVGVSVRHDNQGPNSGEKVRECHALHLFDEMLHSNELGNVGRTVADLTSIRDKGGGLANQPLEYALGVNRAKDNEGVDMKANQLEDDNAISEIGFSSQLIQSNDLLKIVSRAEVPIDGIVITGQTHVNERLITHEARAICERFGYRIIGGTMSDGCLQVKAIRLSEVDKEIDENVGLSQSRVSKGRDQNENDVKQDLKIFQSSYFSGGTVVFSDIHELENYFQLDAYSSKSFLGLMPLKELLNRRCGSVKGEWDDLLAGGSSVTLLTKDICNVLWVSSDALKLIQYGLRTAVVFVMDKPPDIVDNSYESIRANSKRVLELILEKWKSRGTAETIIGLQCCYCEAEEILLFCRGTFNIIGEMTQTTTINFQDDRRDFVSFLCDMIKLYVVIFSAFIDNAGSLLHADIFEINRSIASSLVDMYAHCGVDIEETVFYLMISRGLGNMGQIISSMADSSNKNSFSVEVVEFFAWDSDPGSSHIKRAKAEMSTICVLDYENGFSATEVPQFGGIDFGQGFSSDEMHKSGFMLYGLGSMKNFATPHEVIAVSWNVNLLAAYVKSGDIYSGHQLWGDNTYVISFSNVTSWNHIFCCYFQNEINMEVKHIINSIQEVVVCWNYMIAGHSLNSQHEVITMQISYATILSCCAKLAYSSPGKHVHARLSLTKFRYVNDALVEFHEQMSPRYKSKIMKYLREHLKSSSELLLSPRVIQISLVESTYQTKLVMTLSSSLLDELYNTGIGFSHIATSMQSVSIGNGSMLVLLQLVWLMLEKLFECEHKENVFTSFELLLTNQFIIKALGFQQKLFILIGLLVTESLPYDLIVIWGDEWFLSGKHYCFLGYVDEVNKCSFKLLDKVKVERKCDSTIDITLWKFETTKYYTDIVAPRHPDFIKDMITSTSKADNAILIIDSTTGGSEADISKDGLACEYTLFTFILGDKQMIYCCNKTSWDAILSCRWLFELQLSSRVLLLCSYDSFQISTHHGTVAATFFSFFLITCGAVFEDLCFWGAV